MNISSPSIVSPRPLSAPMRGGRGYELLDLSNRPIGRFPHWRDALDEIDRWPCRTVFVLRRWLQRGGRLEIELQWLISRGLDGRYRATTTQKHWTMRSLSD